MEKNKPKWKLEMEHTLCFDITKVFKCEIT